MLLKTAKLGFIHYNDLFGRAESLFFCFLNSIKFSVCVSIFACRCHGQSCSRRGKSS